MKVILKNTDEEYSIREIINSYLPKEKIVFCNEVPTKEDYVYVKISKDNNDIKYFCKISLDKKTQHFENKTLNYSKMELKKVISQCFKLLTGITLPWGVLTGIRPSKIVREYKNANKELSVKELENHLTKHYETTHEKASLAVEVEKNESIHISNMHDNSISLYIGIPFCPTRCAYCSFTSQSIAFSNKLVIPYLEALKKEIYEISKSDFIKSKKIETIYFGGGTPSSLTPLQIDELITYIYKMFDLSYLKEITFEAGRSDTIDEEKLNVLKKHNIKRICINPQTVNDETLKKIGRNHSYKDFEESFNLARKMGFTHINCDIIAGLPGEDFDDFKHTIDTLIKLNPESITVHTMSIKHGSYFDMNDNTDLFKNAKTVSNMLDYAHLTLKNSDKIPYYMYRQKNMLGNLENVGYCNLNCHCLYNIYIMEEVQSIIALGAGGSTKIITQDTIERVFNVKEVSEYIKRIDEMIDRKLNLFSITKKTLCE